MRIAADNEMIQYPNIHQAHSVPDFLGNFAVGGAGLGDAGRVIVLSTPIYVAQ